MISGHDIVFISSVEWDFLWQVHQEVASRFAAAGNRVLYIENTGVRAPALQDARRVVTRLNRWARSLSSHGIREVAPNIFVVSPLVAPPFGRGTSRFINRRALLPLLVRTVRDMKIKDPLIWTYLPTDTAIQLIRLFATPASVVTYYCGADFSLLANDARRVRQSEDELLRVADLVLATCPELFERCRKYNRHVHAVPSVINLDQFELRVDIQSQPPIALAACPRPIIGYVGGLHRFVDYELLRELIAARPEWSFVFVGASSPDGGALEGPNVYLLGQRPHAELHRYIEEFDVCIVPYSNEQGTSTVVPMKINEYLALGKPVVSTELPTVRDFNEQHRILITAPSAPNQFLHAIERALLLPRDAETLRRRRAVAALGDSREVVARISDLLELRIQEKAGRPRLPRVAVA